MKICFIDFYAYPLFNPSSKIAFGGSQVQLYTLGKRLAQKPGYEIAFITDPQKNEGVEEFGKVKVYPFLRGGPILTGWLATLAFRIAKVKYCSYLPLTTAFFLLMRRINADIYVQRAAGAETGLIALITKVLGKRFVYMVAHRIDVSGEFVQKHGRRGKLFQMGLYLADTIVCQSQEQFLMLPKWLRRKSVILKTVYEISDVAPEKGEEILWVGRAESWKQPEIFLNLAEQFPGKKFVMVATEAESDGTPFRIAQTRALTLKNVEFIAGVPFHEIDAYFQRARMFVNTSNAEGFPNTFIQAAKNRTPIVSLTVNPDDVIGRYEMGVCANGDEKGLAKALAQLSEDTTRWQYFSENAFRYAREHHDLEGALPQYDRLLQGLRLTPLHRLFGLVSRAMLKRRTLAIVLITVGTIAAWGIFEQLFPIGVQMFVAGSEFFQLVFNRILDVVSLKQALGLVLLYLGLRLVRL